MLFENPNGHSFIRYGFKTPVSEVTLALAALKDGNYYLGGSGVIIAPRLAITARHVIEDFWAKYEAHPLEGRVGGSHSIVAMHLLDNGEVLSLHSVIRTYPCPMSDLAFIYLEPLNEAAQAYKGWAPLALDLLPPELGTSVACYGYPDQVIEMTELGAHWKQMGTTSVGTVQELHQLQRDSYRLTFPCFRTNARFDGGMSGAPVFNEAGRLCGLVSSNLAPSSQAEEHVSYVASLWPLMVTGVDFDTNWEPTLPPYPAIELAVSKRLNAENWHRVVVRRSADRKEQSITAYIDDHSYIVPWNGYEY